MDNIQLGFNLNEDIFDDFGNYDIEFIDVFDYSDDLNDNIELLIQVMNETLNDDEPEVNVICEITEDVPLRKKPRLHFLYHVIEN